MHGEMEKLMHHDEQELLSLWEGCHWDDHNGGWLDPELCAKARREEVKHIVVTRCARGCPERRACVRRRRHFSRQDGRRLTRRQPGKPNVRAKLVAKEYKTHARPALVRLDAAAGGAESRAVGGCHRQT